MQTETVFSLIQKYLAPQQLKWLIT